jgi:hypothetical protein
MGMGYRGWTARAQLPQERRLGIGWYKNCNGFGIGVGTEITDEMGTSNDGSAVDNKYQVGELLDRVPCRCCCLTGTSSSSYWLRVGRKAAGMLFMNWYCVIGGVKASHRIPEVAHQGNK